MNITKIRVSIRTKILVPAILLLVLGMGASTIVTYINSKKVMEAAYEGQMKQVAHSTIRQIDTWISAREVDIRSWSQEKIYLSVLQNDPENETAQKAANDQLEKLKEDYKYYEYICVTNASGDIRASSDKDIQAKTMLTKQRVFQVEPMRGYTFVSDAIKSEITQNPVFIIASTIIDSGQVVGVFFGVIGLIQFNEIFIEQVKVGQTGDGFVFNEDGVVIAHSNKANIMKLNISGFDFGREMIEKGNGLINYTYENSKKVAAYVKSEKLRWILVVGADESDILAPIRNVGYLNLLISFAVTVFLMLALGFLLHILSIKPIARVRDGLRDISEEGGDLTARVEVVTEDETGDLARWFNAFVEKIHIIMKELAETTNDLSLSSAELSALSEQMASSAEQMSSQSDSVSGTAEEMSATINAMASAAEEMSVNIQSVSSTAEELSQNMNAVASSIEEMSVAINEVAASAQEGSDIAAKATEMSDSATDTMNALGDAAKEIGEVTDLIKRIAEQTNLLALNATIEAASAGDAGKGFAVVANEIKELANQSAQAAEDIARRIGGVQANTAGAIKVIGDISDVISRINESATVITKSVEQQTTTATEISGNVQQANTGVNNISSSISEVSRGATDVAKSAAEAAKGVNEVSANIQMVNKAAGDSSAGAQQVNTSAGKLAKIASQILEMVGRFKVEKG